MLYQQILIDYIFLAAFLKFFISGMTYKNIRDLHMLFEHRKIVMHFRALELNINPYVRVYANQKNK